MSLTKDKLITCVQTQVGLDKQESHQIVERLLGIMKDTLAQGEELLITGFGKFSVRQFITFNIRHFGPSLRRPALMWPRLEG